ncbi:membrane fusion protein, cobalt-zinc-cadmium efflux system [Mariprofundus micogutta]|uniref:Membrane fusion protein, cobalt-zinc-cadmium efflux system n=1 Tax=Mariprofundus micogutta TaxID=1921010 RepID=A0A1L8CP25_9PROT|nr:efflux RND transporter periplasmic adaptor subunit [Mariprofundus micogutta]GAV20648.1 membrane fusion protein, cobalt-zinc-cadmium efflux system [Mariprofundus micogutta]
MKTLIALITTLVLFMSAPAIAEDHGHEEAKHVHESHAEHKEDGHEEGDGHKGDDDHEEKGGEHEDHGVHKEEGSGHGGHGTHEEEGGAIKLTPAQIKQAGIESEIMRHQPRLQAMSAPGSVTFNRYNLADITTLVDGVVHARHVRLGNEVQKGQKLVTLTSSELAQAEAGYLRAEAEHRKSRLALKRVEGLAKEKIVSQARLQQAQSSYQAAHANLAASKATLSSYGLSRREIGRLLKATRYGQLTLYAPAAGTVVADAFIIGQHIAAGTRLMQIVDESTVWVEVKLAQSQLTGISTGRSAVVSTKSGNKRYKGKVINIHHQLDQITRTVGVRLEVKNPEDVLHPGMFVQAEIEAGSGEEALLLPESAIQRQGNELIVFVEEEPGHFERREVKVGKAVVGMVIVLEGLKEGESVVINGSFVLASELAKSGFETHNH